MDPSASLERHLQSLEQRLLEPKTRKDAAAVAALLTDDFVEFGSSGRVFDKASVIAALGAEVSIARSMANFTLHQLAEGVALVTYVAARGSGPNAATAQSLRSSIWKRCGAEWKLAFHQGTTIAK